MPALREHPEVRVLILTAVGLEKYAFADCGPVPAMSHLSRISPNSGCATGSKP